MRLINREEVHTLSNVRSGNVKVISVSGANVTWVQICPGIPTHQDSGSDGGSREFSYCYDYGRFSIHRMTLQKCIAAPSIKGADVYTLRNSFPESSEV